MSEDYENANRLDIIQYPVSLYVQGDKLIFYYKASEQSNLLVFEVL